MFKRPPYIDRRIDFALRRQAHVRHAPKGCRCPFCVGTEEVHREIMARVEAQRAKLGEPPF